MTKIRNFIALGAAALCVAVSPFALAQDDLDDLLKDLENESQKPAAKAETPVAEAAAEKAKPVAEAPTSVAEKAAEEPAQEAAEEATEESAEEVAEEPAEVAKSDAAAPAVSKAEGSAEEKPASNAEVDGVLNLLDELASETNTEATPTKPAEGAPTKPVVVKTKPVVSVDEELIGNIMQTERLRRRSQDAQAKRNIVLARECMSDGEFLEAVRYYGQAAKLLNDSPTSKSLRRECDQGMAEGLFRAAVQEDELGRRDRAISLMEKALDMRHPKARRTLDRWTTEEDPAIQKAAELADRRHRMSEDSYKANREQIRKHLRRSRQHLALRDMKTALDECEVVLVMDPYNQEAIRLRNAIERKRKVILQQEREAAREGMIADVDEAWRPVYAVKASGLTMTTAETVKTQAGEDPERTMEQDIEKRMKEMRLPNISFKPPATIMDAVDFFRVASKDYDRPDIPIEKRGFNFVLKTSKPLKQQVQAEDTSEGFGDSSAEEAAPSNGLPPIPTISASDISFHEALKLVCESVGYKFIIRGSIVMVMPMDMSTTDLLSRKYDVLDAFLERMTSASSDVKEMRSQGFGSSGKKSDDSEENQERDWKAFFEQMGVKWPEESSIMYIKTLGKLYVRNTRENLAEFEKVLVEMGSQPKLIEIETRFVEVAQEDLNSLGFEWLLNSNYSFANNYELSKIFGTQKLNAGAVTASAGTGSSSRFSGGGGTGAGGTVGDGAGAGGAGSAASVLENRGGIEKIDGTTYSMGNRYLSTTGNHISGAGNSTNDKFMRVNAFLGAADVSMILHMLSQRSDTDLLSAPKVVTKSGEEAVIKVVTEYIYPQDYDVQLQSSQTSGGGGGSGSSSSCILAVVEPQNFTMREQGVILNVRPTYSEANGGTIDLELKPEVVDEPTWQDYGMKIPFTGNPTTQTIPGLDWITAIGDSAKSAMDNAVTQLIGANKDEIAAAYVSQGLASMTPSTLTWYDAPMKQPFFHVRKIDSKVSITPGATVVMGGLITEQRKAMDDKVPFLGDLPFVGRFFRSHAEQTIKRNLLIFVTGRLITPAGRELRINEQETEEAEVKAAPKAE